MESRIQTHDHVIHDGEITIIQVINPGFFSVQCRSCPDTRRYPIGVWGILPCQVSYDEETMIQKWYEWLDTKYVNKVLLALKNMEKISFKFHTQIKGVPYGSLTVTRNNEVEYLLPILLEVGCGYKSNNFDRDINYIASLLSNSQEPEIWDSSPQMNSTPKKNLVQSLLSGNITDDLESMICEDIFPAGKVKEMEGNMKLELPEKLTKAQKKANLKFKFPCSEAASTPALNKSSAQTSTSPRVTKGDDKIDANSVRIPPDRTLKKVTSNTSPSFNVTKEDDKIYVNPIPIEPVNRTLKKVRTNMSPISKVTKDDDKIDISPVRTKPDDQTTKNLAKSSSPVSVLDKIAAQKSGSNSNASIDNIQSEKPAMFCPSNGVIHGNFDLDFIPLYFHHTKLDENILSILSHDYIKDLTSCQKFSISAILEGKNFLLIARPRTKRGSGCILPLLSLSLKRIKCPNNYIIGCLIICPDTVHLKKYARMCHHFASQLRILEIHSSCDTSFVEVFNGYDVVLTTPTCCTSLFKLNRFITKELKHILFINTDSLFATYKPEMEIILNQTYTLPNIQFVFIAESWNDYLKSISSKIKELVICLTSYLEAALYSNILPELIYSDDKLAKLIDAVKNNRDKKIAIFAAKEELQLISSYLQQAGVSVENSESNFGNEFNWQKNVILCTSLSINYLNISNAQLIIHYSLPDKKSEFESRLAVASNNLAKGKCNIKVLFDKTNTLQLPTFIKLFTRKKIFVPEELKVLAEKIELGKEMDKYTPLCTRLLEFGKQCQHCSNRHAMTPDDFKNETNISNYTYLKVAITEVHSATHYSARLLAHTTAKSINKFKWTPFESNYHKIFSDLFLYFVASKNKFNHRNAKIGDIVAIEKEQSAFKRARITGIKKKDRDGNAEFVEVYLIDEGSKLELPVHKLYILPEEFCKYPDESFDLYLANVQPSDKDLYWHHSVTKNVKNILNGKLNEGKEIFFAAEVAFVIGHNILMSSFYQFSRQMNMNVIDISMKNFLLESSFGEQNNSHLKLIKDLASKISLTENAPLAIEIKESALTEENTLLLSQSENSQIAETEIHQSQIESKWLSLSDKFFDVQITEVISKSLFFAKRTDSSNIEEQLSKFELEPMNIEDIIINTVCVAKLSGGWHRCLVYNIRDAEADVFFVDYGDRITCPLSSLYILPDIKAPFQVIECELSGILFKNLFTEMDAEQYLLDQTYSEGNLKVIKLKVCEIVTKTESCKQISDFHYKVVLIDPSDNSVLNSKMVELKYADWENKNIVDEVFTSYKNSCNEVQDVCNEVEEDNFDTLSIDSDNFHGTEEDIKNISKELFGNIEPEPEIKKIVPKVEEIMKPEPKLTMINGGIPLKVYWKQTEYYVEISIIMGNMTEKKSVYDSKRFYFETKKGGQLYKSFISFYADIDDENVLKKEGDDSISFRFKKQRQGDWPRLTYRKCNSKIYKMDISSITEEEEVNITLDDYDLNLDDTTSSSDEDPLSDDDDDDESWSD